jgi:signal transduction histidine kinase
LGLLTAGLAHEIRNPLVAIRTFTQLLPERYEDAEFREGFQGLALKEVDRICGLINDLLSFARPSKPNVAQEDMNDVVEGIARILESQAKEKGVEIARDFGADLPKVWIDREQMKQVFMNLILNAIQAMKEGGSIYISTRQITKSEAGQSARFVQIEVRDTGVGIPEDNLDHIFDPFFTSKDEGSGLGLSISHQIVQEHGGYVTVESKIAKGTSFFVNIPIGKPIRPTGNGRAHASQANLSH